jgi:hypothetical protein
MIGCIGSRPSGPVGIAASYDGFKGRIRFTDPSDSKHVQASPRRFPIEWLDSIEVFDV